MRLYLVFFLVFILQSCGRFKDNSLHVTGSVGEILIVCENEFWEDPDIKKALDSAFTKFIMPYFPDVPTFELIHRTKSNFDGSIKRHRNVLILNKKEDISSNSELNRITDGWAYFQSIYEINFRKKQDLIQTLKSKNIEKAHDFYANSEWERMMKYFNESSNKNINDKISKKFKIKMALPEGSGIVTNRNNFMRLEFPPASRPIDFVNVKKQDVGNIWEGIMIYQYAFKDSSQFELENLLHSRDSVLKENVPHEIEGLYMGTQYVKMVYPEINLTSNFNQSIFGYEMRGMFAFVGKPVHSTGGAFWSFHFLDERTMKILCISGYVDAPSTTSWIHFLREIQAVWKSVELDE